MDTHCIRHTELPHTSRLFADFTYHFDRVSRFYGHEPHSLKSYKAAAAEIDFPADRRAELVRVLRELNGDSPDLDRLAQPGTLAVVTGQQVGLFSGPAYTIYKALTAVRLAEELSRNGIPAVPIFWLATEDHDLDEVNHCWVFDSDHQPVGLSLDSNNRSERPVGMIPLGRPPVDALRQSLSGFAFGEEISSLAAEAYQADRSYGSAFGALLKRLLGKHQLLMFDPMTPGARKLAAPLLAEAVGASTQLIPAILDRNQELAAAGYHAQVHVEAQTSLLFLLDRDRRITLRRSNGEWSSKERMYEASQLRDRAEHLSPNALLRPVVQDYILPTVAYVGGPAELAYLAQSEVIYREILGRMPVAVSRSGFTLLDDRTVKLMKRYELTLANFFHGEEELRGAIAAHLLPEKLAERFTGTRGAVENQLDRLGAELAVLDPTLNEALGRSRKKILYQLSKIERKTSREVLRRTERAEADASYLYCLVYPHKHMQERFYSILPFMARQGTGLIDLLYENVRLNCPDHQILEA
jgi:bacillithiol biosynthesis cysteine-adding enzyme BshC